MKKRIWPQRLISLHTRLQVALTAGLKVFRLMKKKRGRKKKMEASSTPKEEEEEPLFFPAEVVTEILSWLPLKPLTRAQLVCKEWRSLIQDHRFVENHMKRSSYVYHWYNVNRTADHVTDSGHATFSFHHGFHGLLLMRNNETFKAFLWNPAAGLALELPHQQDYYSKLALVFIPATKSYKIVSLTKNESRSYVCEVLTPGPSMSWSQLPLPDSVATAKERPTSLPGEAAVHFVCHNETVQEIVTLDVETEELIQNRLPSDAFDDTETVVMLSWNGKLGFCSIVGEDMLLMLLEDHRKKRWSREKEVIHLSFLKKDGDYKATDITPLFRKEDEIYFKFGSKKIFTYDIMTGKVSDLEQTRYTLSSWSNMFYRYKPSFVIFDGMQQQNEDLERYRPRNIQLE